jgi:hypothetical protein
MASLGACPWAGLTDALDHSQYVVELTTRLRGDPAGRELSARRG